MQVEGLTGSEYIAFRHHHHHHPAPKAQVSWDMSARTSQRPSTYRMDAQSSPCWSGGGLKKSGDRLLFLPSFLRSSSHSPKIHSDTAQSNLQQKLTIIDSVF